MSVGTLLLLSLVAPGVGGQERATLIRPGEPAAAEPEAKDDGGQPQSDAEDLVLEESIVVTEVLLDALVTDRKGNVILGLEPEDFVVTEEGNPVELTGLTFYSNREYLSGASATTTGGKTSTRYFIFLLHDQTRGNPDEQMRLSQAARDSKTWIRTQMLGSDLAAVASFDHKLKIHQDFTSDREALLLALNNAARGRDPGGNWPSRSTAGASEGLPSLLDNLPRGNELRKETALFTDGLRILGRATKGIAARKTLFLFSSGFEGNNLSPTWTPDQRYYPRMMQTLNASNVAVYTLDLTRVGSEHRLAPSLHSIAADTGGRLYDNAISFRYPLERVANENSGYYLLSYSSKSPRGESGYKRVQVRLRNREFRVTGRQGFLYGDT